MSLYNHQELTELGLFVVDKLRQEGLVAIVGEGVIYCGGTLLSQSNIQTYEKFFSRRWVLVRQFVGDFNKL